EDTSRPVRVDERCAVRRTGMFPEGGSLRLTEQAGREAVPSLLWVAWGAGKRPSSNQNVFLATRRDGVGRWKWIEVLAGAASRCGRPGGVRGGWRSLLRGGCASGASPSSLRLLRPAARGHEKEVVRRRASRSLRTSVCFERSRPMVLPAR